MHVTDTAFSDVKILFTDQKDDARGSVQITLDVNGMSSKGIDFACAEQRIYRIPAKGTFFGIHFQTGSHPQEKLIRLLSGRGMDYIVDLRTDSVTYRKWIAIELNGSDNRSIYIPRGYGHAFLSLDENTTQLFSVSERFHPDESKAIRFDDPQIGLILPTEISVISERDRTAPFLSDIENDLHNNR